MPADEGHRFEEGAQSVFVLPQRQGEGYGPDRRPSEKVVMVT